MIELKTDKMLAEKADGIGWMTFNNPARRNATSLEMWQAIADILGDFAADPAVRVVVMRGAGDKAFVSGADISQFETQRADAEAAARYNAVSEHARHAMESLEKPLIAMIRGYCLGGGVGIAMAADMRFAADGRAIAFHLRNLPVTGRRSGSDKGGMTRCGHSEDDHD